MTHIVSEAVADLCPLPFRLVSHAALDLGLVARAIDDWDGPRDIDLGGVERQGISYMDEELEKKLELQYAQAAFASCYVAEADTEATVQEAHSILARLAELLDFIPPPDLATSVDALPKIERHTTKLDDDSHTVADLLPDALLKQEHPLTTPRIETFMLLQMMVYSAYQFSGLQHPLSLVNVAKLHFYATRDEQVTVLRKILRGLSRSGASKNEAQWLADRAKLVWLWNWGIEADAAGVLNKISQADFEEEMLKVFTETSCKLFTNMVAAQTPSAFHSTFRLTSYPSPENCSCRKGRSRGRGTYFSLRARISTWCRSLTDCTCRLWDYRKAVPWH